MAANTKRAVFSTCADAKRPDMLSPSCQAFSKVAWKSLANDQINIRPPEA